MKKVVLFLAAALMGMAASAQVTTFPWTEGFENGATGWTIIDSDGDGITWQLSDTSSQIANFAATYPRTGNSCIIALSYDNLTYEALTPDEWLISPAITIPAGVSYTLSFYDNGTNPSYAAEHYAVHVASANTVAAMSATTALMEQTLSTGDWIKRTVDLSAYAGQTIYIGFRHFGCTDQFCLGIDDIRVGGADLPTLSLAGLSNVALNSSATFTATSDVTPLAWYVDGVQQTETGTTFTTTFTTLGNHTVKVSATNAAGTASDSIVVNVVNASVTTFPWVEDFEANATASGFGTFPVGWTTYADNVANYSQYAEFGQSWSVYDFGWFGDGSAICMTYTNSTTACDRWLVTPQLVIPATGDFKLKFDVYGSQYSEKLGVLVSTTGNAKTDFTQTVMPQTTLAAGANTMLFDLSAYVGQSIYIAFRCTTTDGIYTLVDNVTVSADMPAAGISYTDGMVQGYAPMGTNFSFYTMVRNEGTTPMTSYTLTYTVNGTAQTRNVTGINVAPFAYYIDTVTISHPTAEAVTIALTVSAPNGVADPDASDNSGSLSLTVYDPATVAERTTLLDHFTTAVCPNCPSAHTRLGAVMENIDANRVAWVAHHVGYGTDNMTLAEDAANTGVMGFYNGTSTFAPAMLLDRDTENVPGEYNGMVGGITTNAATLQNQFSNAISKPAFVTVGLENITYDASTRQVSFDVNGMFKSSLTGTINLTVYITEDSIMGTQSGATGNYRHDHVLRGVVTSYWGDALTSTNANDTYSKHYTYTLPATWNYKKCRLIAFVNNHSNNVTERKVLNATKSAFLTAGQVGIEDVKPAISVKMWPNPVAEMAFVEAESTIRSYSVVNSVGQVVESHENVNASALELNVSNYAAGVYFVSVTTDNGVSTERLSVVK
ncbi:MAG: choice-of-anchor J domain-containing protein [Bacteroidales bacterium]|nr:choice-of-anchor J domain-containing protein [Bacteroidales bacterium]